MVKKQHKIITVVRRKKEEGRKEGKKRYERTVVKRKEGRKEGKKMYGRTVVRRKEGKEKRGME